MLPFFGSHTDSNIFPVLLGTVFRYSYGFYLFPVLAWILQYFGTQIDSILFRYSRGQFLDTRTDSTFSRYSSGFYHFSVLTQILIFFRFSSGQFCDTRTDSTFSGTRLDSTIFRYSDRFDPFPVLAGIVFRYSYGF